MSALWRWYYTMGVAVCVCSVEIVLQGFFQGGMGGGGHGGTFPPP